KMKLRRNGVRTNVTDIYRELIGTKTFCDLGNPNLGEVTGILVAVENAKDANASPLNAEVWINELRLSSVNENGSYAALGRVDMQLADLGRLTVSGNMYTQGFGSIEQKIGERARDNMVQFDAALSIDAGKLVPKTARLSIPIYASINKTIHTPQYDPFDKDVLYKDKISTAKTQAQKDSIKNAALDQTTIKTLNFTNVRVMPKGRPKLLSISNFDVSYSFTQTLQINPTVLKNEMDKHRANLGYTFNNASKYIEPFKKLIKNRSIWLNPIKDFNFNLKPSLISFRADVNRQFGQYIPRVVNTDLTVSKVERVDTTYDKYFKFDRFYNLRWDFSRSLNFDFKATNNAYIDEPNGALNTKAKRDTVRDNFLKGGRNIQYNQEAILTYTIPINKLPLTDWITARYNYGTSFSWVAASRLAVNIGNILENSQRNNLTTEFDFTRLYNKSRWLRNVGNVPPPKQPSNNTNKKQPTNAIAKAETTNALGLTIRTKDEVLKDKDGKYLVGKLKKDALSKWRQQKRDLRIAERLQKANEPVEMSGLARGAGKLLTMVKRASINYSENYHSRVPGYLDSTQILGQNFKSNQPGLDYVFGAQPDTNWLNKKAAQGVISRDSSFNDFYRQNFQQTLNFTAQLEPIREFTIDLNLDKSFSKEYSELFKDTATNNLGKKQHLSPYASGGFSVSYISFGTLFNSSNPNQVSATFKQFESNRLIISKRVAAGNPYYAGLVNADGYATGYGRYSQDVLIPAFLAAYTGKDANSVGLINQNNGNIKSNPFRSIIPKPNWRLTYTGLSKLEQLAKTFTSITLTHSYKGELSMNSYTSALNYYDPLHLGAPQFIDTVSGNYIPFFLLPNITIKEDFGPLIGIEITTIKQLNLKFLYNKSRQLSLSLIDYQLSETNSSEFVIGGGYRVKGFRLPFKLPGMKNTKLDNDLSFKLDLGIRNDATSNSRLDQQNAYGTGGQKVVTIQPSIDYVLNKRINLKLFFDQRRVTPYISTSAPTINTRAGVSVRINLAP
ncbi:MAG: cell surface protein SprA, partial [Pedobacter sp.]|nr:cell surface protein SprA [Chitinophagaceae bacterium]